MSGSYFLYGSRSIFGKCGNFWQTSRLSGWIWPDWGKTTWADMAGLGSIGLRLDYVGLGSFAVPMQTSSFSLFLRYSNTNYM